jgi:histidinol-phosphate/aromatic aminotransferase/cobyric acid decarboxylase-like protein
VFISDWYCEHPFAVDIIPSSVAAEISPFELLSYQFHNDDYAIPCLIQEFHGKKGENSCSEDAIFTAAGLSPLIAAQMLLLHRRGVRRVYYVRPLYYTFYFFAETFGIELVPVNDHPLLDESETLRLPTDSRQWLLLSDPIWFAGRNVHESHISHVILWQEKTGGTVLVDGAFQYQRWSQNQRPEQTARLDPALTLRNVCPTKAAAVHGIRFAYALIPVNLREELRYCYSNTAGSASAYDKYAAQAIMLWLNRPSSNETLLNLVCRRHSAMTKAGFFDDPIGAGASYFCFVRVPVDSSFLITMDQTFFDTVKYPDLVRFNLLLPKTELTAYVRLAMRTVHTVDKSIELDALNQ